MNWFYALNGQQMGPVSEGDFEKLIAEGTLRADTIVWREGMNAWQPLSALRPVAGVTAGVPGAWSRVSNPASSSVSLRYAGFWIRFVARVIDALIQGVVTGILRVPFGLAFMGVPFGRSAGEAAAGALAMIPLIGVSVLISTAVGVLYEGYFLSTRGATPGKMVLGLKVIRADGGPISFGLAVGRFFAAWVSGAILLIGYIMAAFDSEKRSLHDHICGTRVISG